MLPDCRGREPVEHAYQGRLARAVLAEQSVTLAYLELQAGAVQCHGRAKALVHVAERDERRRSEPPEAVLRD